MAGEVLEGGAGNPGEVAGEPFQHARAAHDAVDPQDVEHFPVDLVLGITGRLGAHKDLQVLLIDLEETHGTLDDRVDERPGPPYTFVAARSDTGHHQPKRVCPELMPQ